ncbi:MAG TPA: FAD-dependent oxidoreductase [Vicinamibacterales bacterium]|nr:FAD-dependent oxidoreductase [Vicinamibacterales bacterium]
MSAVRRATPSTRVLRLEGVLAYRAGQAAQIGPASSELTVPYSIASSPEDTASHGYVEFLVKVDAQERWGQHFDPLRRGQTMRVRGPLGRFTFPEQPGGRDFLFIAGGTGIAPLRSMLRHARASGYLGSYRLLYSARTPADFAYLPELRGMARRGELQLVLTATRGGDDVWKGHRGRIAVAQLAALIDTTATLCFVCGPAAMVDDVPRMLGELGIDRTLIRLEEW